VSQGKAELEKLIVDGAGRLLARASDCHRLEADVLVPRIKRTLDKYLLRDNENAPAQAISEFIDSLQADDLCLIIACECGEQTAWNDLVGRFSATVRSAARSASSNEAAAEDLAQSIWAELYGLRAREDGKPASKLAYYSGRGSLAGWLRAVVAQLAIDQHRKQARLIQTEDDADFDLLSSEARDDGTFPLSGKALDPERAFSNKVTSTEMGKALARALAELSPEDRLLVRLYYFDGRRLREAGSVLGVHEATASRRLTRIHAELRRRIEEILISEKGWTKAETERSFSEVALHLEADLEPMLATEGAGIEKPKQASFDSM
jgi:RNA polymerase sigma-70 factor, ECF subfamily